MTSIGCHSEAQPCIIWCRAQPKNLIQLRMTPKDSVSRLYSFEGIEKLLVFLQGEPVGHPGDVVADQLHLVFLLQSFAERWGKLIGVF